MLKNYFYIFIIFIFMLKNVYNKNLKRKSMTEGRTKRNGVKRSESGVQALRHNFSFQVYVKKYFFKNCI